MAPNPIRAQRDWPLQRWGQERVVHGRFCSNSLGALGNGMDIDHAHERIAGRLNQDQRRFLFERRRQRHSVVLIDEGCIELAAVASALSSR
jgi:hypothetical protein